MRCRAGERGRAGGGSTARHRTGRDGDGGELDRSRMRGNGEQQEEKREDTPRATDGHAILQEETESVSLLVQAVCLDPNGRVTQMCRSAYISMVIDRYAA